MKNKILYVPNQDVIEVMCRALKTYKDISEARKKRIEIINNTKNGETIQKTR